MTTITPDFSSASQSTALTSPSPFGHRHDHVASPSTPRRLSVQRDVVTSDDGDDDQIVWPVSSQSSTASVSPALVDDAQDSNTDSSMSSTNNKSNKNSNTTHTASSMDEGHTMANAFLDDFELERGDYGSKVWTPLPSVKRPRGRGHRSTKSESALPAPLLLRGSETALESVKEAWADDMTGLERQMARASLAAPLRASSTDGAEASHVPQSPGSNPRKQRGQKKQKESRPLSGVAALAASSAPKDACTAARSYPSPAPSPDPDRIAFAKVTRVPNPRRLPKKKAKKGKGKGKPKKVQSLEATPSTAPSTPRGLGTRSIVDDVSENGDSLLLPQSASLYPSETDRLLSVAYDEAVKFMNAFIQHPDYYTSRASRLTFLQALTVELGLVSATGPERALPESLTAAKALLKSHAFLNIKDYLTAREKGLDALRSAMRPSRSALVRELRGRGGEKARRAKLGWVKETGLTVLLVSCRY